MSIGKYLGFGIWKGDNSVKLTKAGVEWANKNILEKGIGNHTIDNFKLIAEIKKDEIHFFIAEGNVRIAQIAVAELPLDGGTVTLDLENAGNLSWNFEIAADTLDT